MAPQNSPYASLNVSEQDLVRSALGLAERAKARFLEGAADEAKDLIEHALNVVHGLDDELEGAIVRLAQKLASRVPSALERPRPEALQNQ